MGLGHEDIEAIVTAVAPAVTEALARRVLELVDEHQAFGFVDAAELARVLGVDREWVYAHAERLGAIRLGDGPRPRLRFEIGRAVESFARLSAKAPAVSSDGRLRTPVPRPRRSRRGRR